MNQSIKKTKWILLYYDILKEMKLIEHWRVIFIATHREKNIIYV